MKKLWRALEGSVGAETAKRQRVQAKKKKKQGKIKSTSICVLFQLPFSLNEFNLNVKMFVKFVSKFAYSILSRINIQTKLFLYNFFIFYLRISNF